VGFDNHLIRRFWRDSKFRLTEIIQKVGCRSVEPHSSFLTTEWESNEWRTLWDAHRQFYGSE
jgi:hypothetical protein